jgi:hypothetical protein
MSTIPKPPRGSVALSKPEKSPKASLMSGQSKTSRPPTSMDSRNATSSQESAGGLSLFDWQDGRMIAPLGRVAVHANLSAKQAKERGLLTSATFGLPSSGSSVSATLQSSLESRLRARMDVNGSLEFVLTWKTWDMLSGPPICALRASMRRTSDKGCTGWPTTGAGDDKWRVSTTAGAQRRMESGKQVSLEVVAHMAVWATPNANNMNGREGLETWDARQIKNKAKHGNGNGAGMPIAVQVQTITGWPTCKAQNSNASGPSRVGNKADLQTVAGWCSPTVTDASRGVLPPRPQDTGIPLSQQVSGLNTSSSSAETAKPAALRLNPRFSLWLMGYPIRWHDVGALSLRLLAAQEMPSCRKSRRSLSKPLTK